MFTNFHGKIVMDFFSGKKEYIHVLWYRIEFEVWSSIFHKKMDEVKVRITIIYKSNRLLLSKEYKLATEKNWERLVQFMNFT